MMNKIVDLMHSLLIVVMLIPALPLLVYIGVQSHLVFLKSKGKISGILAVKKSAIDPDALAKLVNL